MFSVFLLCGCFVWANGYLKEVQLPAYVAPSQDLILNKYFRSESDLFNRNKKSIPNDLPLNVTLSRRERFYKKNSLKVEGRKPLTQIGKVTRLKVWKPLTPIPGETTTSKYPTATYSVEKYEKLKAARRNFVQRPSPILKPPLFAYESPDKVNRGKIKWKGSKRFSNSETSGSNRLDYKKLKREEGSYFLDKYLEEALMRYLVSLNLTDHLSIKTFTEILKNATLSQRTPEEFPKSKTQIIKFKENPIGNKRKTQLQRSLQRRLGQLTEKPTTSTTEAVAKTTTIEKQFDDSFTERTATEFNDLNATLINEVSTEQMETVRNESEVKLSVAETVYYRKRHFPVRSLVVEQDKSGVIPGVPEVDYPMYSYPPVTGFKCPNIKGSKRPKMMADTEARCQVFYICTGDGPAAAMLCPNGTMFNENVLVCDWWYNVDC